ncbi:MAG: transporter substrate-binding domain-containing protein [Pseudomonas sp.]|uniref:substrate-binding periplasmic protein n=1 Tax=Pseudomonas sp. TaxID=306 RepID=UPI0033979483
MRNLCCGVVLSLCGSLLQAAPAPVQICIGNSNEWAPFTYWERKDGQPDREQLTGSATTLVLGALKTLKLDYQITYLPWARVQRELAEFARDGRCELTWDASYKAERAEYAYYSVVLYQTRLGLFYSPQRFQQPPMLNGEGSKDGLARYHVCGVIGYNYAPFVLADEPELFPSVQQNLDLLARQRCDFFPSEIEPLYGGLAVGAYRTESELRYLALPAVKRFYVLVSKGSPRAERLLSQLNQVLIQQQESGEAEQVLQRFLQLQPH